MQYFCMVISGLIGTICAAIKAVLNTKIRKIK